MAMRSTMGSAMGNNFGSKTLGTEGDEREELCLYLFKTHARNKMLAFKRILPNECPLRMLPLDYLETLEEDGGFEHIVSTTTSIIDGSKESIENNPQKKSRRIGRRNKSSKTSMTETHQLSKSIYVLCFVSMV